MQRLATEDFKTYSNRRLQVRKVDEEHEAELAVLRASKGLSGEPVIHVTHGGGVWGNYPHAADTEGLVTLAWPDGRVCQKGARLSAKGVTLGGVLAACFGTEFRAFLDERYSLQKREMARKALIEKAEDMLSENLAS